jgi:hypothetical protein
MRARVAAAFLGLVVGLPAASALQPCGPWQWVNPLPQRNDLFGVAYGQGGFVAVGALGTILTSPDGGSWTCFQTETSTRLNSVIWDGTRYIAVGNAGTVLLSPDAITWTSVGPIGKDDLFAVTVGGGQYVAVGANGAIFTSTDGLSWTKQDSGTVLSLFDVTWAGNVYLAVGEDSQTCGTPSLGGAVLRSADGRVWSAVWFPEIAGLRAVASNGSRWVAVGSFPVPVPIEICGGSALFATSDDGVSWSVQEFEGLTSFVDVIWSGTEFVAVGGYGGVATSPDGIEWTIYSTAMDAAALSVTGGPTTLVAVGEFGLVATSPDAQHWTTVNSDAAPHADLRGVVRGRDRWVISGASLYRSNADLLILASLDGTNWQRSNSAWFGSCIGSGSAVASNGVEFILACGPGKVLASPDGLTWSLRSDNRYLPLRGLVWTGSEYLGFTYDYNNQLGSIYSSPDGAVWSLEYSDDNFFSDAASNGSVTVAAGGTLFFKENGGSWFGSPSPGGLFRSVAWGGGVFVATGSAGVVAWSTDGLQWTSASSGASVDLWDVTWDGNAFIAVGSAGTIVRSRDGIEWSADRPATSNSLNGVVADAGCAMVAGDGGVILRSGCPEPRGVRRHLSRLPVGPLQGLQSLDARP